EHRWVEDGSADELTDDDGSFALTGGMRTSAWPGCSGAEARNGPEPHATAGPCSVRVLARPVPESTPSSATSEPTTEPAADAKPAGLVVRYRYAEGILLLGFTRPHRIAVKVAMPRWRWLQSLRRWGVPRTRGRALSREEVDAYAHGLTRAGVPNVRVDYQEPRSEEVERTAAERERPGFDRRRLLELVRSAGPGVRGRRA